jgi:hypothetical protein
MAGVLQHLPTDRFYDGFSSQVFIRPLAVRDRASVRLLLLMLFAVRQRFG